MESDGRFSILGSVAVLEVGDTGLKAALRAMSKYMSAPNEPFPFAILADGRGC